MIGKIMFIFGIGIVYVGVSFEDIAVSFFVSSIGIFNMWVSVAIMIKDKSEWIDEDLIK